MSPKLRLAHVFKNTESRMFGPSFLKIGDFKSYDYNLEVGTNEFENT